MEEVLWEFFNQIGLDVKALEQGLTKVESAEAKQDTKLLESMDLLDGTVQLRFIRGDVPFLSVRQTAALYSNAGYILQLTLDTSEKAEGLFQYCSEPPTCPQAAFECLLISSDLPLPTKINKNHRTHRCFWRIPKVTLGMPFNSLLILWLSF